MKIAILIVLTLLGLWYNGKATRHWWAIQRQNLPQSADIAGWIGVGFSGIWYFFVFVFFIGLTVNNTIFR